jgi:hypothetical protein
MLNYRLLLSVCVAACTVSACREKPSGSSADSAAKRSAATPAITGSLTVTGWDSTAGPVMLVAMSRASPEVAIVLPGLTDSTLALTSRFELAALENTSVELFSSRGLDGSSVLRTSSQPGNSTGCVSWPIGRLTHVPPMGWRIGFEKGKVVGLPLDSLEGMGSADSSRFAMSILRAVGSLGTGGDAAFRGIPYFIRKGYRLTLPSSSVLIAEVVRRINEEANPREEHLLLLAERSGNEMDYRVAFSERSAGAEEVIETSEILAAVRFTGSNRVALAITFDYEDGGKVALLERVTAGNWRIVWKSAYTDC